MTNYNSIGRIKGTSFRTIFSTHSKKSEVRKWKDFKQTNILICSNIKTAIIITLKFLDSAKLKYLTSAKLKNNKDQKIKTRKMH